mgnify:CR=1 FL=1
MTKIIAELCQNHNGDLKILKEMVHAASEAGADYCKIQSISSAELTHRKKFDEGNFKDGKTIVIKRPYDAELKRLKPLDLSEDDQFKFLESFLVKNLKNGNFKVKYTSEFFEKGKNKINISRCISFSSSLDFIFFNKNIPVSSIIS